MKKFKKSTSITIALLIYVSVTWQEIGCRSSVLCHCVYPLAGSAQKGRIAAET